MKAIVKATGLISEVCPYSTIYLEGIDTCFYPEDVEIIDAISDTSDYWTRLEHQYAGMAMQGILSNPELFKATAKNAEEFGLIVPTAVVIDANCFAHALVEKMKEVRDE